MSGTNEKAGPKNNGKCYDDFLVRKSHIGGDSGFAPLWMPDFLYPFQSALADWSIRKGKAAVYADCGL